MNEIVVVPDATGEAEVTIAISTIPALRKIEQLRARLGVLRSANGKHTKRNEWVSKSLKRVRKELNKAKTNELNTLKWKYKALQAKQYMDDDLVNLFVWWRGYSREQWQDDSSIDAEVEIHNHIPKVVKRFIEIEHHIEVLDGYRVDLYVLKINESLLTLLKHGHKSFTTWPKEYRDEAEQKIRELFARQIPLDGRTYEEVMDAKIEFLMNLDPDGVEESLRHLPGKQR